MSLRMEGAQTSICNCTLTKRAQPSVYRGAHEDLADVRASTMHSTETLNSADAAQLQRLRMPAEWEPHEATWLAWPHYRDDWPGKFEPIPWVYAEIIRHLARHERVDLIVNDVASEKRARKVLDRANALSDNVRFHRWPTNRVWTRDSGCTFLTQPSFARPDSRGRLSPRFLATSVSPSNGASTPGRNISNYRA